MSGPAAGPDRILPTLSSLPARRTVRAFLACAGVIALTAAVAPALTLGERLGLGLVAAALLAGGGLVQRVGSAVVADGSGVDLSAGLRRRRLGWSQVLAVRADERRRTRGLEFDLAGPDGEELVVVASYLLGEQDLRTLAADLEGLRRRASGASASAALDGPADP